MLSALEAPQSETVATAAPLYLEVSPLLPRRLTGMGRFVARLVEALARRTSLRLVTNVQACEAKGRNQSTALLAGQEMALEAGSLPAADEDIESWVRRLLQHPVRRHNARRASACTGVYTWLRPGHRHFRRELNILYDFTPLVLPWTHIDDTLRAFGTFATGRLQLGDKAVAISAATRADACWLCGLPEEDVVVGYPGPSLCVHGHAHREPVERSPEIVLVVSTLEPRKNGRFLTEWFLNTPVLGPGTELWWVGPEGWLCDWFNRARRRRGRDRRIRLLGMVSDRRLCELYRRAAFTIYPSLYEGFGFPVLDSLRYGAPVLCGYHSALQEFGGPGVFYFDPCDAATLDIACRALLDAAPALAPRADLEDRFCWDRLAETVLALAYP
jgi:glycosyltransferase involved in cell wall biosynthesis